MVLTSHRGIFFLIQTKSFSLHLSSRHSKVPFIFIFLQGTLKFLEKKRLSQEESFFSTLQPVLVINCGIITSKPNSLKQPFSLFAHDSAVRAVLGGNRPSLFHMVSAWAVLRGVTSKMPYSHGWQVSAGCCMGALLEPSDLFPILLLMARLGFSLRGLRVVRLLI